jgi:hypothetical protein
MAGRIEYKYLAPVAALDAIRADIQPYLAPDPFSESSTGGEYSVRSIYYDTPHFACYREKDAGVKVRNKFRIRGYNTVQADSIVFLEIKKRCDCEIAKNRAALMLSDLPAFMASPDIDRHILALGGASRARDDARRFLYYYYRLSLQPAALVVYDREAFFGRFDSSLRVTFDKRLRGRLSPRLSQLHEEDNLSPVMKRYFILELKFFRRSLPQWASDIVQRYELPRMALSKYTLCVDLRNARPRLPHAPRVLPAAGHVSA